MLKRTTAPALAGLAALLALVAAVALPGRAAGSVAASSGSLTMTSDPGDYIGQGANYSFTTPDASFFTRGDAYFFDGNMVGVSVMQRDEYWLSRSKHRRAKC